MEESKKNRWSSGKESVFFGTDAELKGPAFQPFFWVRFPAKECRRLLRSFEKCATPPLRRWFTLTATYENPTRVRLTEERAPKYELDAARNYVRGDLLHVTGREGSCNIKFAALTARLLADEMRNSMKRMQETLELVVPNRHKKPNIVEFIPDTECKEVEFEDIIAVAGAKLAGTVWPKDDFSDWEEAGI